MPLNEKNIYSIYLIIILGFLYSCFVGFKYIEKYDFIDDKKLTNHIFSLKKGARQHFGMRHMKLKQTLKRKDILNQVINMNLNIYHLK